MSDVNKITKEIANAYAELTNKDEEWVEDLSLTEFMNLRNQAILEMEKHIGNTKSQKKNVVETPNVTTNEPIVSSPKTIPHRNIDVEEIKEIPKEETKVEKKPPQKEVVEKIEEKTPIKTVAPKSEDVKPKQEKPFDKLHDEEELELFNLLKE